MQIVSPLQSYKKTTQDIIFLIRLGVMMFSNTRRNIFSKTAEIVGKCSRRLKHKQRPPLSQLRGFAVRD